MPDSPPVTCDPNPSAGDGPPTIPLRSLAIRGVLWTTTGFGASQILRLAFNLILTRLLVPELFGIMAVAWAIVTGINLFCDLGIAPAVIRDPRGDTPEFLHTAWTLQIIRGCVIGFLCFAFAVPLALLYGDPRLRWVFTLIGLTSLASGFNSTSLLTLQRRMAVRPTVVMELGAQIIGGVLMIVWAWLQPGIWALISGSLAPVVVRLVWSHFLRVESQHRMSLEPAALREILVFGRWVWTASILTFLASQVDRLIFGKLFTFQVLGVYSIAAMIAEAPRGLIQAINHNVIFPSYAKSIHLPRAELRAKILRYRWPLLVLIAGGVAALTAVGDIIVRVLYDKRYAAACWMLPALALGIWPSALSLTIESALAAIGKPRYAASANFLKFLFTAIGIPLGFSIAGVAGAVIVVALNDLPFYGRIAYGLWREGLNSFAQDFKATALLAAMLALAFAARLLLGIGFPIH